MNGTLWSSLAGFGIALILCATAAGSGIAIAVPLLLLAAAHLAWAVAALRLGRIAMPRVVCALAASEVLLAGGMLITGVIGFVPFLALAGLSWSVAAVSAVALRRAHRDPVPVPRSRARRPGVFVLVLVAQALVVSAVTTPALALSTPGEFALPHGESHQGH